MKLIRIIVGLNPILELLTQKSMLLAFALPNHKDL